jgi:hypothetical protein
VRIERRGQEEIAREHGISQPRVSRIVRRMAAWYAEHSPEVLELADLAARGRLAEVEFRAQTEQNLTEAISALRRSQEPLVTKKERKTTTKEQGEVVREVIVEETTTRQQPVSTRAITLAGKFARELWELAGGLGARGSGLGERRRGEERESGRAGDATADHSPTHHSPNEEDVDDRLKDYERRQREGRKSAVRWLESVCRGSVTLEEAEHLNYCGAINTGWIYPSYYEKNADGMTFKVAAWVRDHVPPERLHGPERQPVWTCTTSRIGMRGTTAVRRFGVR